MATSNDTRIEISEHRDEVKKKKDKSLVYRLLVMTVFLTSLSMCVYQTHELVVLYQSEPIETQIRVTMNDVMEFPAVTVCNLNPVRRSSWELRTNGSEKMRMKQEPLTERIKSDQRSRRQSRENDRNDKNLMADNLDRLEKSFAKILQKPRKRNRIKRQMFLEELRNLRDEVNANKLSITSLISEHNVSHREIVENTKSNISQLWLSINNSLESLTSLEGSISDLARRLSVTEMTTSEMAEEMSKTKGYLMFLKANMSNIAKASVNGTAGEGGEIVEKLEPSKDMKAFQDYLRNLGNMSKEDIRTLGHKAEDFIATCTWKGGICQPSHFTVFQNFMYGNCFTFDTSKVDASVTGTGPYNGLSLSLFVEQEEYIDRVAPAAGARVVLHDLHHRPFPEEEGFSVAPGFTTAVFLGKSTTKTVKPMCDPDIDTSYEYDGKEYKYSQKACAKQCLSDEILRQCKCAASQFLLGTDTCSPDSQVEVQCVERLEELERQNKLPCHCPSSCRTTTYNPIISSASWPSERYLPALLEELIRVKHKVVDAFDNITDYAQYFRKHFLRLDIFFQELTEQEILQRYSYGIESLLSDIGGQLGLWIGVSVATLFESIKTMTDVADSIFNWFKGTKLKKVLCSSSKTTPVVEPYKFDLTNKCVSRNTMVSISIVGGGITEN